MENAGDFVVVLPWPPRACQPNSGAHHHTRSVARRRQHRDAAAAAMLCGALPDDDVLQALLIMTPKDRRRRDLDNLIASMKGALDGVFAEQARDDRALRVIVGLLAEPDGNPPRVELRIRAATAAQRQALGLA